MNSISAQSARAARLLRTARYAAVGAAILLLVSGPGHRWRIVPFDVALKGPFLFGVLAAVAAFVVGGVVLLGTSAGRNQPHAWRNWLAFGFGAAVVFAAAFGYGQLRSSPMLHDLSTDTVQPPEFVEVLERRSADHAVNGPEYLGDYTVGAVAVNARELQKQAYPDVRPVMLRMKPPEAFVTAEKAARAMGWEIVAVVANEGRIEATDTTLFFGLKDDIAIRVRSERNGRGSIIDMRSASRSGANDVGRNARRIRAYRERLIETGTQPRNP